MKIQLIILLLFLFACGQNQESPNEAPKAEQPDEKAAAQQSPPEKIPYGNNPEAGDYFDSDGVKLYYEIYGSGDPILMLRGGVYGYIDEFEPFIPKLAEKHQVICLGTRGHGKSEIGHEPFTYEQRAKDAYRLLQHLNIDQALVIGFSDGGFSALKLAALYPEAVSRLIAMGVADLPKGGRSTTTNYTPESLMAESGAFFETRLKLTPEPDRWGESLQYLNHLYNEDYLSAETLEQIKCPVLLMNGEKDRYAGVDAFVQAYKYIPNAHLSIIPNCGHVIFYCNFGAVWESMAWFL